MNECVVSMVSSVCPPVSVASAAGRCGSSPVRPVRPVVSVSEVSVPDPSMCPDSNPHVPWSLKPLKQGLRAKTFFEGQGGLPRMREERAHGPGRGSFGVSVGVPSVPDTSSQVGSVSAAQQPVTCLPGGEASAGVAAVPESAVVGRGRGLPRANPSAAACCCPPVLIAAVHADVCVSVNEGARAEAGGAPAPVMPGVCAPDEHVRVGMPAGSVGAVAPAGPGRDVPDVCMHGGTRAGSGGVLLLPDLADAFLMNV